MANMFRLHRIGQSGTVAQSSCHAPGKAQHHALRNPWEMGLAVVASLLQPCLFPLTQLPQWLPMYVNTPYG